VSRDRLEVLARRFTPPAEVVAEFREAGTCADAATAEEVLALLRRRPCSARDVADGLGIPPNEALKRIDELLAAGRATPVRRDGGVYYTVVEER
jgi:hypothetical protein